MTSEIIVGKTYQTEQGFTLECTAIVGRQYSAVVTRPDGSRWIHIGDVVEDAVDLVDAPQMRN